MEGSRFGRRRKINAPKRIVLGLTLCCLAVAVLASVTAQADDTPPDPTALPTVDAMEESLNPSNSAVHEPEPTNPQAAEELPHQDLDREQTAELLSEVFNPELQAPAGIFDELEVARFLSDYAAVIPAGNAPEFSGTMIGSSVHQYEGPTLMESTVPLRSEDSSGEAGAVDLGLEHLEGELQPANPLVEVGIPESLGEGVSIADSGVTIKLEGAPSERAPSTVEDSVALYPEVASDSSLAIAPTPSGVETLSLLQSADAPSTQTFHLDLPEAASLRATADGGAEVVQDNHPLIGIAPPSALDANGAEVPVKLEVAGDSLRIEASPGANAAYPILVDPVYYDYNWLNNITGTTGWKSYSSAPSNYYAADNATCTSYASPYSCPPGVTSNQRGMYLGLLPGSVPAGSAVYWNYYVPRWEEDWTNTGTAPTSFITSLTFETFNMWSRTDSNADPTLWTGIWNPETPGWVAGYSKGGDTAPYNFPGNSQTYNAGQNTNGKIGALSMGNGSGHNLTAFRDVFLGRAIVNLGDNLAPKLAPIPATAWSQGLGKAQLPYTATDTGLGVSRVEAKDGAGHSWRVPATTTCAGTAVDPCPRTPPNAFNNIWTLEYDRNVLPQGISKLSVTAEDPLANKTAPTTAEVLIDRTAPGLTLSGTATEQATAPNAAEYQLQYSATDGDRALAAPLTQFSEQGTGEGKLERPLGVAVDKEGNAWVIDRTNRRVEEFNQSGQFVRQFGSSGPGNGEFTDPCGIAISSAGNVVVTDMTNNTVQTFSPTGQFMRSFTYSGFLDPYAVAPGSGGALWVSDTASHRVYEFSETGTLINTIASKGAVKFNMPSGLATDAAGNLWVSDTAENQIYKFSPSGELLLNFGSPGAGNGQFANPTSIAVAPSGNIMVSDASNNRLQEFQPNGVYLRKFGTLGTGAGQVTEERGLAFGPGNILYLADAGNHRIARWAHGDFDPQSGAASTEVKVDGQLVEPKYSPGCPTEDCAITNRAWTLHANAYSSGQHTVKVTATDAVGLATSKEFTITTDATAPQLTATKALFTAPEGWVEQKSYSYNAIASDVEGSGVKSLSFKIDGKVVKSVEQSCLNRGCSTSVGSIINMANYQGGKHPAELIATDVAGNTTKKVWTINVDPKGSVPPSEASSTIEAVEETEPGTAYLAPTADLISAAEIADGNNPGLTQSGEELTSTGVPTNTTMTTDPDAGLTIEAPRDSVSVEPIAETSPTTIIKQEVAAVTSNTASSVDSIVRPKYNGDMVFQSIRDTNSPESFSWEVDLGSRLSMSQVDEEHIGVYHPDGSEAMLISAELAHDAVGKAVATTLALQAPNIVTLTVHHKVAGVVYPVVSGASFEMGYESVETFNPPPEEEPAPEGSPAGGPVGYGHFSAPQLLPYSNVDDQGGVASRPGGAHYAITYTYDLCAYEGPAGCYPYKLTVETRFEYNMHYAWWKEDKPHPKCPHSTHGFTADLGFCNWVGKNHQPFGGGYHITSRGVWTLSPLGGPVEEEEPVSIYMYGDGYANGHNTMCICNPLPLH